MMRVKGVINVKYGGDVVNGPATREGSHSCILCLVFDFKNWGGFFFHLNLWQ